MFWEMVIIWAVAVGLFSFVFLVKDGYPITLYLFLIYAGLFTICLGSFFVFYLFRYFWLFHHLSSYKVVPAHFVEASNGGRFGTVFTAQFQLDDHLWKMDTHRIFGAELAIYPFVPQIADYANRDVKVAYSPDNDVVIVIGLM